MSELQTLKTAIHEIAHAKLHDIDLNAPKDEQQPRVDRRTREVEAESVAYTVCQHYGLDTSDYSFGYVAGWSSGRELAELLLQQQPVARDLRQISAALKMITDMERIGDQAQDIAEIVTFLKGRTAEHDDILCQMARATISMVTESVDAFVKHDTIKAEAVLAADDTVDAYFRQVKQALISRIAADPADGEYALDLLMIAKYFERIGDHATNIAEWVIFSITGRHKEG